MIEQSNRPAQPPSRSGQPPAPQPGWDRTPDALESFIGGSPLGVAFRLGLLCVVVGLIMATLGMGPADVLNAVRALIDRIAAMGWGAVTSLIGYFVLGASIVVPIWLVVRFMKTRR